MLVLPLSDGHDRKGFFCIPTWQIGNSGFNILMIERILSKQDRKHIKSARSKGFVAKRAYLVKNPHKREDWP